MNSPVQARDEMNLPHRHLVADEREIADIVTEPGHRGTKPLEHPGERFGAM